MGTKFFEASGANSRKGVAADCVSFCERALAGAGAISPVTWPDRYVTFGGGPEMLAIFLKIMDSVPELHLIWWKADAAADPEAIVSLLKRGDLILCSSGKALHHLAIFMGDNTIAHCLDNGAGVQAGNTYDPIVAKNIFRLYRARKS